MAFLYVDADNSLVVEGGYEKRATIADLGGCWDAINKVWRIVFTVSNLEKLLDSMPDVIISDNLKQQTEAQVEKEAKLEKLRAMSKQDVPVCLKVPGLKLPLYNYQRLGVMYAVTNGVGLLLADHLGLGKTLQSIGAAVFMKSSSGATHALVITPASLKYNWPLEIEKFTSEKYVVIDGTPEERVVQWLRNDVFFYIVNYELVVEDLFGGRKFKIEDSGEEETEEQREKRARKEKTIAKAKQRQGLLAEVRNRNWSVIIVDEAGALRHHDSSRSRAIKQLHGKFKMALTGTPLDGRLEELHSLMQFVAPGLLMSKTRFFQKFVETDFWGKVTGYKKISEVTQKIQPFFLRRLKQDVLKDLPGKIYENKIITLSPEEMAIYKQLAKGGHEATEDALAMTAIIRCKQFCNYPSTVDDTCKTSSKMDAFKEVVDEVVLQNGSKIIIFTQYKEMLKIIDAELVKMGVKFLRIDGDTPKQVRADMQGQFNGDKSIDAMIGTDAMSLGLNFQAASVCISYDDFWSPSVMEQRSDRAHRLGQKNTVTVIGFVCKDTIEERIKGVLCSKARISAQVLGDDKGEIVLSRMNPKEIAKLL